MQHEASSSPRRESHDDECLLPADKMWRDPVLGGSSLFLLHSIRERKLQHPRIALVIFPSPLHRSYLSIYLFLSKHIRDEKWEQRIVHMFCNSVFYKKLNKRREATTPARILRTLAGFYSSRALEVCLRARPQRQNRAPCRHAAAREPFWPVLASLPTFVFSHTPPPASFLPFSLTNETLRTEKNSS